MARTAHYYHAPRLEVVVIDAEGDSTQCELVLVFHLPDGKEPDILRLGGPYTREQTMEMMMDLYTTVAGRHGFARPDDGVVATGTA